MKRKSKKNELPALSTLSPVMPDSAGGISHFNNAMGTGDGSQAMGEALDDTDWEIVGDSFLKSHLSQKAYIVLQSILESNFSYVRTDGNGRYAYGDWYEDYVFDTLEDFVNACEYNAEQWSDEELAEITNDSGNNKMSKKSNKLLSSLKEEKARYSLDEIKREVVQVTLDFMQTIGFDEDMAAAYTSFDFEEEPDRIRIEVGAELSYDELVKLAEELDGIIYKYSDSAYFEPEDAGLLSCIIWKKSTVSESIKGFERRLFNNNGADYNLDCLYEAVKHKLTTKDKSDLQDMIRKSDSAEEVNTYLTGLLNEEYEDAFEARLSDIKIMHEIMLSMNNEDAYFSWIYTMPDEPTQEDFEDFASDENDYLDLCNTFARIYNRYKKDGLYKPEPELVGWLSNNGYDTNIEVFN